MATASLLIFSSLVIFDPALGKRIQNSEHFNNAVHHREGTTVSSDSKFGSNSQTPSEELEDYVNALENDLPDAPPVRNPNVPPNNHGANPNVPPNYYGGNPNVHLPPNYMPPHMVIGPGDPRAKFWPINPDMQRGREGEPLIPELVPPMGSVYVFKNIEKPRGAQFFFEGADTNEYKWEFDEIQTGGPTSEYSKENFTGAYKYKLDQKFATLKGKWQSNMWGHKSVHVLNNNGVEMFKIRAAKHTMNPFKLRWSFRILPAGSKSNDDTLFTVIRDYFGKGAFWIKEEWRIYQGRKRSKKMVSYGIGNYIGWDFKFYKSKRDYDAGDKQVIAKIEQKRNAGVVINHAYIPDKFKLKVYPGGDSALLLAVSSIIDMVHDTSGSQGFVG